MSSRRVRSRQTRWSCNSARACTLRWPTARRQGSRSWGIRLSTSVSQTTFRLSVDAGVTTELFVVDSTLNLVQRGIGRLDATLPAGIYKVRALAGRQEDERIVLVNRDTTVEFANDPSFASPAPLLGTSR